MGCHRADPADRRRCRRRSRGDRWDGADVLAWEGSYGDYLTAKVAKVFPDLFDTISTDASPQSQ